MDHIAARVSRTKTNALESTSRPQIVVDEIKNYLDSRYVSLHKACWRMLEFDIHHREHAVQILSIHLQNMQRVVFKDKDELDSVVFVWNPNGKYWSRRRQRHISSIGRLTYVHPTTGDLFYQRMLLCHQKGCRRFRDIRKVNDIVYPTCRATCQALGLLEDDQEWENTMQEAACTATPAELQTLFAHILTFCHVTDPVSLWGRVWKSMSEDLPYTSLISLNIPNLHIDDSQLEDYVLYELEGCLNHCSRSLTNFGLQLPPEDLMSILRNRLLMEKKSYNRELLAKEKDRLLGKLNVKQRHIFDLIMTTFTNNQQELIFVYGHGGTGKTFIWKTITYTLRAKGKIILAVVSSSVASLLLPARRTTHSRFKLLLDLTDTSLANGNMDEADKEKVDMFAKWLLDIGDGSLGITDEFDPENTSWVDIPDNYRIPDDENKMINLIRTYVYGSYDEALPHGHDGGEVEMLYPREYLNTLSFAGLPPHRLELKIGLQLDTSNCKAITTKGRANVKNAVLTGLQLSGTSATHYYFNPNKPETYHIKQQHELSTSTTPFFTFNNQRYVDLNQERTRNCFPLATLLEVDP
ncbi:DNA helicase [Tanacetum coccineum]|uniref:ATP-dependent DNA helicase n=1 Tax=Tanacetum coccineum TaxID=301880 RepID=A0ABQ4ZNB3_9ASTR